MTRADVFMAALTFAVFGVPLLLWLASAVYVIFNADKIHLNIGA